jgi:hypothetical protein
MSRHLKSRSSLELDQRESLKLSTERKTRLESCNPHQNVSMRPLPILDTGSYTYKYYARASIIIVLAATAIHWCQRRNFSVISSTKHWLIPVYLLANFLINKPTIVLLSDIISQNFLRNIRTYVSNVLFLFSTNSVIFSETDFWENSTFHFTLWFLVTNTGVDPLTVDTKFGLKPLSRSEN